MKVTDLTAKQQKDTFKKITKAIAGLSPNHQVKDVLMEHLLEVMIDTLDDLELEGCFGEQGWKQQLGVDVDAD